MSGIFQDGMFKLGFGLMRLPKRADGSIDIAETSDMVDAFMAAGGTYFDTAYVYDDGESEKAIKKALVDRYPRESYTLATKLNAFIMCKNEAEAKQEIDISIARTGAGYIDYYLLHAIQRNNKDLYDRYGLWDYVKQLKAEGKIRHYGFSFHADPEFLETLLTEHPDVEFVQLQVNYADWENPGVASKRNIEICRAHGKPVIVMEPVKGGILADPIPAVKDVLSRSNPDLSCSAWALRFVFGVEGVSVVLSGMSSLAQMQDNLKSLSGFTAMSGEELETIERAREALDSDRSIPCTACRYCTDGCPMNIPIPDIFTVLNRKKGSPAFRTVREYNNVTEGKGRASDCIACGQCEGSCPQHLPIIELLKEGLAWEE